MTHHPATLTAGPRGSLGEETEDRSVSSDRALVEQDFRQGHASEQAAPQDNEPMTMLLCEFGRLLPRPGEIYIAKRGAGCAECDRLAAMQSEAYGKPSEAA